MSNPLRTIQWIIKCGSWHPHFCLQLLGPLQTGRRGRTSGSHCRLKMLTRRGTASSAPTLQPSVHCISSSSVPCDLTVTTCLPSLKKKKNNCFIQEMHTQKLSKKIWDQTAFTIRKDSEETAVPSNLCCHWSPSMTVTVWGMESQAFPSSLGPWQSKGGVWGAILSHHPLVCALRGRKSFLCKGYRRWHFIELRLSLSEIKKWDKVNENNIVTVFKTF